jgi:transcriptional regulator GlxA family with amidase domain
MVADALADALVVHALRASREVRAHGGARDPRITAALDQVHAAYAEPLTVSDLARAAGMSRFHFSRLFQDETGDPPYRYLQRVRVRRGAELLRAGRHSVTEAALAVGFHDFGRFARVFRREIGCLPGELARGRRTYAASSCG